MDIASAPSSPIWFSDVRNCIIQAPLRYKVWMHWLTFKADAIVVIPLLEIPLLWRCISWRLVFSFRAFAIASAPLSPIWFPVFIRMQIWLPPSCKIWRQESSFIKFAKYSAPFDLIEFPTERIQNVCTNKAEMFQLKTFDMWKQFHCIFVIQIRVWNRSELKLGRLAYYPT